MLAVAWQLPNSNCLSQGHPTWSCCRVHQTPHGWRGQRISCQDDINDFQQPFLMPLSDTNKKQFPKSSNIYIYIKHDSNQVFSQLFRHVWLRHLTLWETCPAFSETFSPTSGVRVMVRSCPEVRQQPLRRFVGQLDRALQEADGDPHPGDIWRQNAPHGA